MFLFAGELLENLPIFRDCYIIIGILSATVLPLLYRVQYTRKIIIVVTCFSTDEIVPLIP